MADKHTARALGERIAQLRRERDISQEALAKAVGVSRSAVAQWERGYTEPASAHMRRISEFLECSIEWLSAGRGDRALPPLTNGGADGHRVDPDKLPATIRAPIVSMLTDGKEVWQLSTDKIAGAGYRRGDYLLVDLTAVPQAGNFVLAAHHGRPLFRVLYPPHLFAIPFSGIVPHITIDGVTCIIRGVVVARYSL